MAMARTLYLFSPEEAGRESLRRLVNILERGGTVPSEDLASFEELMAKLEGGQVDCLLLDGRATGGM